MTIRIIPRLDIKGPNLVKGIQLEGLRVLGKPESFAKYYYDHGADELVYMDVVASLYQRNNLADMIAKTASQIFIPLTVGGGIRSLEDIHDILRAGADKVSLNTAVLKNPELIRDAARQFGSSTIVVSIEAIKTTEGNYEAYTDNGRESTGVNVFEWAVRVAELGAGEILITSIEREGTGRGYDLNLTEAISKSVDIPVVACGGAGNVEDIYDVVTKGKADGVCMASILHYGVDLKHLDEDYGEGNIEYLRNGRGFSRVDSATLEDIKAQLLSRGIDCRPVHTK